jgi:hypothetical protein
MVRARLASTLVLFSVAVIGCSDSGGSADAGGDTGISSADGTEGANGNDDNTTAPTTTNGDGDGDPTTGDGDGDDGNDGNDDSGTKWDLAAVPDSGGFNCGAGGGGNDGDPEFSFLWAANSGEGTISKIDTNTVQEMGRFRTRPDSAGSPSRTSVSLSGHVAVANRSGGVAKFYATEEFCEESNGIPGIQTSINNVALAWDQEECRAWYTPFGYSSQRPVAWAPGTFNQGTCEWEDEMLWTAGRVGQGGDQVVLLDGDTGAIIDIVDVPGLKADSFGIYGAAVDSEGNFWGTGWASGNQLVRVEIDTMELTVWPGPTQATGLDSHWYGMTVDVDGYVWNCASRVARFDPVTEQWTVSADLGTWTAGCMADGQANGLLWLGSAGVRGLNRQTMQVVYNWPTPSSYGVSIDHAGFVWAVSGNGAHRVDPMTGAVTSYNGLVGAYTYSDMTGAALKAVGGQPSG